MYQFLERRRFGFSARSVTEALLFGALFLGAMLLFHPDDPCFTKDYTAVTLFVIAVITLFYGYGGGIPFILLLGIFMKFYYDTFPTNAFMTDLLFVLLFGEFHHFWNRIHRDKEIKADYFENKFNELSSAFYMLKISHDQLERHYVIKPMSLRNAMTEILKKAEESEHEGFDSLLTLLQKNYSVEYALISWIDKNGDYVVKAATEGSKLDVKDPLFEHAVDTREPVYVSEKIESKSRYIAAIPAVKDDEVYGVICIEKMAFLAFNKDNLVSLAALFDYFAFEKLKREKFSIVNLSFPYGSRDFRYEVYRLENLMKNYNINSSLVFLVCHDKTQRVVLTETIENSLRSLEIYEILRPPMQDEVIAILFPLAGQAIVKGTMKRLEGILAQKEVPLCPYLVFDMTELPEAVKYLKGEKDA